MILVDSSVWIDFFRGSNRFEVRQLQSLLDDPSAPLLVADLVLFEVLRGFRQTRQLFEAQAFLSELPQVSIGGYRNALQAAEHYRQLRARGYTVRSPIEVLFASYCIQHDYLLLHCDYDFDMMATLQGLWMWH